MNGDLYLNGSLKNPITIDNTADQRQIKILNVSSASQANQRVISCAEDSNLDNKIGEIYFYTAKNSGWHQVILRAYNAGVYADIGLNVDSNGNKTTSAPTPAATDNSSQIATTAYVKAQNYATLASPALTGTPTAPTAAVSTNNTQIATTAYVKSNLASYMPLSPEFIELSGQTPFVDFHYGRSSADNTARIIQISPEILRLSVKNSDITHEKFLELNYSYGLYWNGYPVGIYQSGETSSITADGGGYGSIHVSFSKAFIDPPVVMVISNGGGGSPTFIATLASVTTTGFNMVYYNVYTSSKTATFKWVAIGRM